MDSFGLTSKALSSRRRFLTAIVAGVGAVSLAACGGNAAVSGTTTSAAPSTSASTAATSSPAASASTAATSSAATSASSAATSGSAASAAATSSASATASTASTTSGAAAAASTPKATAQPTVGANEMQLWEPGWDTNQSIVKGYAAALDALTAKNPKVATVILSESPYPDKFLTASAGGTPPDLILLVPEQDLAYKQLIKSLDSYMQTAKVNPADFAAAGMEQTAYKGHQYMLPLEVDPNFPLVYNKALFQQAGITKPPATMSEADDINQKLFRKNGQEIAQLGMLPPWATYGSTNALYTYFLMFGGGWYDPSDQNKLALTQAGNVNALTWMKKYADQFGGYTAIQNFAKTYGKQGYPDGMGHGLLGMGPMVSANYTTALATAKGTAMADAFALSLMPVAQGVKADPAWVGGWAIGIPTGAKRPDDSWTVLEWLAASPEGTDTWAEINGFLPGYAKSPYFTKHASDPAVGEYITVLKGAQHPHSVYRLGWSDIPPKAFDDLLLNTVQGKTDISTALQQFETVVTGVLKQYPSA